MRISLQRSTGLLGFILISHLVAMLLVLQTRLDITLTAFSVLMILTSLLINSRRYGWLNQEPAMTAVIIKANGRCSLISNNGQEIKGFVLTGSVMLGPLLVIYLQPRHGHWKRSVLIPRDAVDREYWRQLRIRLRDPETWAK